MNIHEEKVTIFWPIKAQISIYFCTGLISALHCPLDGTLSVGSSALCEHRCEKISTKYDSNQSAQLQRLVRIFKFCSKWS